MGHVRLGLFQRIKAATPEFEELTAFQAAAVQ